MQFKTVIGLEIHVQLLTKSKMFCPCAADWFAKPPNSLCCPVCLGLPGALPVPNRKAIEQVIIFAHALKSNVKKYFKFDRKNYFYPDLPKGYQISQYDKPIAEEGYVDIFNSDIKEKKRIRIKRIHLEEDTGKLIHKKIKNKDKTLIDFNRSGVPLMEIVTEADISSSFEAKEFLKNIHLLIKYLGISNADMEKGSMRLEPNISLLAFDDKGGLIQKFVDSKTGLPDYKIEIKNINSFNFVKKAIDFEIERQKKIIISGHLPAQETRGYRESDNSTYSQRSKEEASDYRYFPEPDIPPIYLTEEEITALGCHTSDLPGFYLEKLMALGVSKNSAERIVQTKEKAIFLLKSINTALASKIIFNPEKAASMIINRNVYSSSLKEEEFIRTVTENKQKSISVNNEILLQEAQTVIKNNAHAVSDFKRGKENAIMFLVGQLMKRLEGKCDAHAARLALLKLLIN